MYSKKQIRTVMAALRGAIDVTSLVCSDGLAHFEEEKIRDIYSALGKMWIELYEISREDDRNDV